MDQFGVPKWTQNGVRKWVQNGVQNGVKIGVQMGVPEWGHPETPNSRGPATGGGPKGPYSGGWDPWVPREGPRGVQNGVQKGSK